MTALPSPLATGSAVVGTALATTRDAIRAARRARERTAAAFEALPQIAVLLGELRETGAQLEQLTTFAAQELPEIVYQLEAVRGELRAIERRLNAVAAETPVIPATPRTG